MNIRKLKKNQSNKQLAKTMGCDTKARKTDEKSKYVSMKVLRQQKIFIL